jgi:DNA-damage-inducible protein J
MGKYLASKSSNNCYLIRNAVVRARVSANLKNDVEIILMHLGITMSEAISLYLSQIKLKEGIPFAVKIPNKETQRAIEETEKGIGLIESNGLDDFFEKTGLHNAKNKAQKSVRKRHKAS